LIIQGKYYNVTLTHVTTTSVLGRYRMDDGAPDDQWDWSTAWGRQPAQHFALNIQFCEHRGEVLRFIGGTPPEHLVAAIKMLCASALKADRLPIEGKVKTMRGIFRLKATDVIRHR